MIQAWASHLLVKSDIGSRIEDINLIWLSQDEIDKPNQHVLASLLRIADDLPTLVGNSLKPVYLCADGGTMFSVMLERVSEIVKAMQSASTLTIKSCLPQPSYWSRIRLDVGAWKTEGVQELNFAGAPFENVLCDFAEVMLRSRWLGPS